MMAPVPPVIAHRPEAAQVAAEEKKEKKKGSDPLSFLASITERVLGTSKKGSAAPAPAAAPSTSQSKEPVPDHDGDAGSQKPAAKNSPTVTSSKKATKSKSNNKTKKCSPEKKRKRAKNEDEEDRKVSPRLEGANRPPIAQVVINKNNDGMDDSHSVLQPPEVSGPTLQDEYREQFMEAQAAFAGQQQQQAAAQAQLQQQLLLKERMMTMMMMENPTFSHIPDNFLSRQYAALEQEELELAALRRRREQLLLNMNSREELLLRNAAAAGNLNHHTLLGMGMNNMNKNFDLSAAIVGPNSAAASAFSNLDLTHPSATSASATAFGQNNFAGSNMRNTVAQAAASMGYPSSAMMGGMSNSPLLRALANQNGLPSFQNPVMAGLSPSALAAASDPTVALSAAMGAAGASSNITADAPTSGDVAAKRLAPARGVFNKNIKSNDDVIDSLARANARFYKNDNKKSGQQRFRGYQCEQWTQKYQDLLDFKAENGNCQVPHCYKKNIGLARWVKRQRYQYKLMVDGKQSTMTEERVKLLQDVGFVWDSHSSTWEERLNELREYRRIHGDCNVPSSYAENPKLATWIKCQRRQYKLLQEGRTSNMTLERMTELQRVGFCWRVQDERR